MFKSDLFNIFYTEIKSLRNYLLIALAGIFFSYSVYILFNTEKIIRLGEENAFFELGTAFCFLISTALLIYLFVNRRNIFFLLLSILLFFGAGEELSWGQHILKFSTPETIKEKNVQGEFNLHNIEIFNTDKFNNCRKSGPERLLELNFLFRLFCIIYGIMIPLTYNIFPGFRKLTEKIQLPIPPLSVGLFFILNWIFYKLTLQSLAKNRPLAFYETSTEIYEFIASLVWLLISFYFFKNYKKNKITIKVS